MQSCDLSLYFSKDQNLLLKLHLRHTFLFCWIIFWTFLFANSSDVFDSSIL
ncbi:hypothetical protein MtrunA17_Chr8g0382501 [Medicago truncatula]|uniref:Transmembrane protein n=1 Tax=Medicago truncatula TaxID=3880 RepID=A0A396GP93_MEDTR|nr:hypothetical protein MtrunA17_Chr8g0382501 [Medicago truncatula]